MTLSKDKKRQLISQYQAHDTDTGSPEIQISLLTERINQITEHLKTHPKDFHTRLGLIKLVNKRRKLLDYLKDTDLDSYKEVVQKLDLRK